ncbi:amino acid permease [Mucilaginibacter sp. AK015]|uniref:amino acid permease n=1 Tax=Mucilaginibacter sp. AK015 TaxID=2723072 RepID=UPI00161AA62B|nr:amino acid permease [Mucilaginibacter sp. AK015]MBB5395173.1 APA family basic amino acid/polyamine antiporter [Mucilaginibacter sp. AK015]
MSIWKKKSIESLLKNGEGLPRTLTVWSLIGLGIGAVIGSGLFVSTATAIADDAGASVTIAFVIAALGCALSGFCYAELASAIPVSGSAYTYTYATMGELLAWIIGWDLILEYAVGAATVAISWSQYLNHLLGNILHWRTVSFAWSHSPFQVSAAGEQGILNVPALVIIALMSLLLIKGTRESAWVNNTIVIVKVSIVILIITTGWGFMQSRNHTPYIPAAGTYVDEQGLSHAFGGLGGILAAAGTVFFAFIGFDAVSTTAQETINPKRTLPIGILGTLACCTVLYILFGHVLSGLASVDDFRSRGREASVAFAIHQAMPGYGWLAQLVTVALLAGFSSVILAMLLGQSRVFYAMGKDGLLPSAFAQLHPRFKTPYKANLVIMVLVGLFAAFVPGGVVGHMSSIGTLFAFILVNVSVIILRKKQPDLERQFRAPWVPVVPILGMAFCGAMIYGLGWANWLRLLIWLAIGLVIYFSYGRKNSGL